MERQISRLRAPFWKGDGGVVSEFATRFCGSSDLYEWSGRRPHASVNFITCHDGFTLQDLVSYDQKHNEANGEENRDGANDNNSWNCGVEGPTDDPKINALRDRKKRNFSPRCSSRRACPCCWPATKSDTRNDGNNNAYCQDNELTWLHWDLNERQQFHGQAIQGSDAPDIAWLNVNGEEMAAEAWKESFVRCLGVQLFGNKIDIDDRGEEISGDTLLLLFNADHGSEISFVLPAQADNLHWELMLDTASEELNAPARLVDSPYKLQPCSVVVLREAGSKEGEPATTSRSAKVVRTQVFSKSKVTPEQPGLTPPAPRST
jgi:isoamylase